MTLAEKIIILTRILSRTKMISILFCNIKLKNDNFFLKIEMKFLKMMMKINTGEDRDLINFQVIFI
jgi:hypothetical protein